MVPNTEQWTILLADDGDNAKVLGFFPRTKPWIFFLLVMKLSWRERSQRHRAYLCSCLLYTFSSLVKWYQSCLPYCQARHRRPTSDSSHTEPPVSHARTSFPCWCDPNRIWFRRNSDSPSYFPPESEALMLFSHYKQNIEERKALSLCGCGCACGWVCLWLCVCVRARVRAFVREGVCVCVWERERGG